MGGKSARSSTLLEPPAFRDQLGIPCEGALLPAYGSGSAYVFGGAEAILCQDIPASKPNHSITSLCIEPFPTSLPALPLPIPVGEGGKLLTEFRLALGVLDSETSPRRRMERPALAFEPRLLCRPLIYGPGFEIINVLSPHSVLGTF